MLKNLLITLTLNIAVLYAYGQSAKLAGKIIDAETKEPLYGVNVVVSSDQGVITDVDGKYEMELVPGSYSVRYTYLGYKKVRKDVILKEGEVTNVDVRLSSGTQELNTFVVTGSKYEKKIGEETVSIDVIKPEMIENTNSRDLAEVIQKVPGVNIMDGQAVIRGGANYSYGVGSRVLVLQDGQPVMSGDFMEVRWEFVPIELAEQIEVIKGASSVLYGASALNGIINVRTGWAKEEPETQFTFYQGIYQNFENEDMRWWDRNFTPYFTGSHFSHRQRFKNLDVVIGTHLGATSSYLEGASDQRGRLAFKTRYRPPNKTGLTYGLNGSMMYNQFGRFFLWANHEEGALRPLGGYNVSGSTISKDRYLMANIDPHLTYMTQNGITHALKGRYFVVSRLSNSDSEPNAPSHLLNVDYQFQKNWADSWILTTGLQSSYSRSRGAIYDLKWHSFGNSGVFAQLEKKFNKVAFVGGARYELNRIDEYVETSMPVFRAGMNYNPVKGTYVRASFGQGFRFPSVAERFIDESLGVINIFPNPDLQPERGWNAELGIKQAVKVSNWLGYLDFATFWTEYDEMVEFTFDLYVPDSGVSLAELPNYLGFKSINVGKTRIAGFEVSAMGEGQIDIFPVRIFAGYTYVYPVDLNQDPDMKNVKNYLNNFFYAFRNTDSAILKGLSKFRYRHTLRTDIEAEYNKLTVGAAFNYTSFMDKIDSVFTGEGAWGEFIEQYQGQAPIPGVREYREENHEGNLIIDARIGVQVSDRSKITFLVKNLTNEFYTQRPAKVEPPRSYTLQYKLTF